MIENLRRLGAEEMVENQHVWIDTLEQQEQDQGKKKEAWRNWNKENKTS